MNPSHPQNKRIVLKDFKIEREIYKSNSSKGLPPLNILGSLESIENALRSKIRTPPAKLKKPKSDSTRKSAKNVTPNDALLELTSISKQLLTHESAHVRSRLIKIPRPLGHFKIETAKNCERKELHIKLTDCSDIEIDLNVLGKKKTGEDLSSVNSPRVNTVLYPRDKLKTRANSFSPKFGVFGQNEKKIEQLEQLIGKLVGKSHLSSHNN